MGRAPAARATSAADSISVGSGSSSSSVRSRSSPSKTGTTCWKLGSGSDGDASGEPGGLVRAVRAVDPTKDALWERRAGLPPNQDRTGSAPEDVCGDAPDAYPPTEEPGVRADADHIDAVVGGLRHERLGRVAGHDLGAGRNASRGDGLGPVEHGLRLRLHVRVVVGPARVDDVDEVEGSTGHGCELGGPPDGLLRPLRPVSPRQDAAEDRLLSHHEGIGPDWIRFSRRACGEGPSEGCRRVGNSPPRRACRSEPWPGRRPRSRRRDEPGP
jgi:hypothetical protein